MTTTGTEESAEADDSYENELPVRRKQAGNVVVRWLTTTDHKTIGTIVPHHIIRVLHGGRPDGAASCVPNWPVPALQIMSSEQFNQAFTLHGTIMLLMFATPAVHRIHQLDHAVADRRARCGVPAAEHARLLAVPLRLD